MCAPTFFTCPPNPNRVEMWGFCAEENGGNSGGALDLSLLELSGSASSLLVWPAETSCSPQWRSRRQANQDARWRGRTAAGDRWPTFLADACLTFPRLAARATYRESFQRPGSGGLAWKHLKSTVGSRRSGWRNIPKDLVRRHGSGVLREACRYIIIMTSPLCSSMVS